MSFALILIAIAAISLITAKIIYNERNPYFFEWDPLVKEFYIWKRDSAGFHRIMGSAPTEKEARELLERVRANPPRRFNP